MRPETEAYLRKKYGRAVIGDAREPDAVLEQEPEAEGMAPEELESYRRSVYQPEPPPLIDAEPDRDAEALRAARGQDDDARFRANIANASKKFVEAFSDDAYRPRYVRPEVGAESAELDRQKRVRDYLIRSRQGEANAMNAEAALKNANRERKTTEPKEDGLADEKADALRALAEERRARAAKLGRAPDERPEKNPDGSQLPVSALNELADIDVATGMLDRLEKDFQALEQSGTWAKYRAKAADSLGEQSGPAAQYAAKAKLAMQAVGKILEGGKLAAGDEVKYRELLPKAGDSLDVLRAKSSGMRTFLQDLKTGRIRIYKAGGYKTKGIDDGEAQASGEEDVPMLAPDGRRVLVKKSRVEAALKAGGRRL